MARDLRDAVAVPLWLIRLRFDAAKRVRERTVAARAYDFRVDHLRRFCRLPCVKRPSGKNTPPPELFARAKSCAKSSYLPHSISFFAIRRRYGPESKLTLQDLHQSYVAFFRIHRREFGDRSLLKLRIFFASRNGHQCVGISLNE